MGLDLRGYRDLLAGTTPVILYHEVSGGDRRRADPGSPAVAGFASSRAGPSGNLDPARRADPQVAPAQADAPERALARRPKTRTRSHQINKGAAASASYRW